MLATPYSCLKSRKCGGALFKPEIFYYMTTQIEDPERKRLKIDSIIKK